MSRKNRRVSLALPNVSQAASGSISERQTFTGIYTSSGEGLIRLNGGTAAAGPGGAAFNFAAYEWADGRIDGGPDGLTNAGVLTLTNTSGMPLVNGFINTGTIIHSSLAGDLGSGSTASPGSGTLTNETGAVYDFRGDKSVAIETFINRGMLRKSGGLGTSFMSPRNFSNEGGTIHVESGTVQISGVLNAMVGGVSTGGVFTVAADAVLDLTGSGRTVRYTGSYTGSGAGTIRVRAGVLEVGAAGATFNFPPGLFRWTGGIIAGGTTGLTNIGAMALSGSDQAQLFVRYREPADRSNYDDKAAVENGQQRILIANPQAGEYYVLLHGNDENATAAQFTLLAEATGFEIVRVTPLRGSNTGPVTINVFGSQFTSQTMLSLRNDDGEVVSAEAVQFVNSNQLIATFQLTGLSTGNYRLQADDAGRTTIALDTFTVNDAPAGELILNIWTPAVIVNLGRKPTLHIDVLNPSENDAPAPFILIEATNVVPGKQRITLMGGSDELPSLLPPDFQTSFKIPYDLEPIGNVWSYFNFARPTTCRRYRYPLQTWTCFFQHPVCRLYLPEPLGLRLPSDRRGRTCFLNMTARGVWPGNNVRVRLDR